MITRFIQFRDSARDIPSTIRKQNLSVFNKVSSASGKLTASPGDTRKLLIADGSTTSVFNIKGYMEDGVSPENYLKNKYTSYAAQRKNVWNGNNSAISRNGENTNSLINDGAHNMN